MKRTMLGLVSVILAACGGESVTCGSGTHEEDGLCVVDAATTPGTDPSTEPTDPIDPTGTSSVPSDPKSPTILSVSSNISRMTDDDLLTITAIVTDPDGIEDLIGGELLAPGGASYGTFATSAQEGAYQLNLTWGALDTLETIEFDGEAERKFTLRFYDVAGHHVDQDLSVDLFCDTGAACDGRCLDLTADEDNCGRCGHECDTAYGNACQQSSCVTSSECQNDRTKTCDEVCADQGLGDCVESSLFGYSGIGLVNSNNQCSAAWYGLSECGVQVRLQTSEFTPFTCFCLE